MPNDEITGLWSYRAFHNDPELATPFNDLRFATARLELGSPSGDRLEGLLSGEGWGTWIDWSLTLAGTVSEDTVTLRGQNMIEGETWVYDYKGMLMRPWNHATDPRLILAGSVIRTTGRKRHNAAAGLSATFVAVKRDL